MVKVKQHTIQWNAALCAKLLAEVHGTKICQGDAVSLPTFAFDLHPEVAAAFCVVRLDPTIEVAAPDDGHRPTGGGQSRLVGGD